jgi:iron complex outermembrane receptor protein
MNKPLLALLLTSNVLLHSDENLLDNSLEEIMSMESQAKIDVGSHINSKNILESNSPTDIITYTQIEKSSLTSLTDVLRYFVSGFNAPETSIADGSDHVRAFTLRGMSPDQILVLINGKRVHTSSLLHVNGTIGRGSSNVDLDTIPIKSIQRIEILRDGAAAQYGSDAISGVINIILKGIGHKNSISLHAGQRAKSDGRKINVDSFTTMPLKYDGFFNITMQGKKQNQTNRSGDGITHVGIPDSKAFWLLLNSEIASSNNITKSIDATINYRDSKASAFLREADDTYDSFLPSINAKILDYSLGLNLDGILSDGTKYNISNRYGLNNIKYYLDNTLNYSLNPSDLSSFYNGSLTFYQNNTNVNFVKKIDSINLATGVEYRYEGYKIESGEYNSYINGGSQGFSGYTLDNEVNTNRRSYAAYLEAKYDYKDLLNVNLAGRYENYSDFGSTSNYKLALLYKAFDNLSLRASGSSGFRAPSLHQSNYSHTSTFGGLTEGTFKPDHEVAKLFGAQPLKPEKSKHLTFGTVFKKSKNTYLTLDYFYTLVEDRIMLSNEYTLSADQQLIYGIQNARFFTNAVDTKTYGIDIKLNHKHKISDDEKIDFSVWLSYNKNSVIDFNDNSISRENSFDQIDRIENGQPKSSLKALATYSYKKLDTTLNITKVGSYYQVQNDKSYKFDSEWYVDLNFDYLFTDSTKVSFGAYNLFDTTPNKWDGLFGTYYGYNGIKPYSRYSPYGYSGTYFYTKITMEF